MTRHARAQRLRYVSWIVTLPIALIAISFAFSNRQPVDLRLWPLPDAWPFALHDVPLYLIGLVPLVIGFVAGSLFAWWNAGRDRGEARRARSRIAGLEAQLRRLRAIKAEFDREKVRQADEARLAAAGTAASPAPRLETAAAGDGRPAAAADNR